MLGQKESNNIEKLFLHFTKDKRKRTEHVNFRFNYLNSVLKNETAL